MGCLEAGNLSERALLFVGLSWRSWFGVVRRFGWGFI